MHWPAPATAQGKVCEADRQKFCSDVAFGGGRMVTCLKQHESELSSACKEVLANVAEKGQAIPECRADAAKLCNAAIGDPDRMKACMQEHAAQLSEDCKKARAAQGK